MTSPHTLPVIDISLLDGDPQQRQQLLQQLRTAARDSGFFYLVGHGIGADKVAALRQASHAFFALPAADKLAIDMEHSPHFRGYTRAGEELTRGAADWREQLDIGAERPARPDLAQQAPWWRLQGPNQWPAGLPQLKPVLLDWQQETTRLSILLLRAFAEALQQPADSFDDAFVEAPVQHLKIIRYPGSQHGAAGQGVGAHKDSGFLTLLLQDDSQDGLQVETEQGWIDAPSLPGSFIVNIGEALEMASNGYLRATVHRVESPPAGKERLSVAFFLGPRLDATIPLLQLPPHLAAEARGPEADPANPLFYQVGDNFLKGRLRSHPKVAARHHADLLAPQAPQAASLPTTAGEYA
ncbi:2-oxobutyrate oxidase [Aquitalea sp. FJL05]|uniref:isopenicillin N synthase family dioxygenase n=1 Tax=Aquitalea TaxID=407217 RepID=UPI000F5A7A73|nr:MULTISPECIES: 2-oxoglutarate and iron-dependent oxygenase domain-containing protein [Aquitalea]RQO78236.1 2-oxobutyrate oxidase [Aquitalea sp. FJL05]